MTREELANDLITTLCNEEAFKRFMEEKFSFLKENFRYRNELWENPNLIENVYPYGGYVRDKIAGVEFNDIDIWINTSIFLNTRILIEYLKYTGFEVIYLFKDKDYGLNGSESKTVIREAVEISKDDGIRVSVDFCSGYSKTPFVNPDADVNSFSLHGGELRYNVFSGLMEFDRDLLCNRFISEQYPVKEDMEAFQNIKSRRCRLLKGVSSNRIEKIEYNGYEIIT